MQIYFWFQEDLKILLGIKVEEGKIKFNIKLQYASNMAMYELSREIDKASGKMLPLTISFLKMSPKVSSTKLYHYIYIIVNILLKKVFWTSEVDFFTFGQKTAKNRPPRANDSQFGEQLW